MFKPVKCGIITQPYSSSHFVIDIAVTGNPSNVPVYAARDGVLSYINNDISSGITAGGGFGRVLYILSCDKYYSIYAHLSILNYDLQVNQIIHEGDFLGIMGSTGLSSGNHLHYEERLTLTPGNSRSPVDVAQLYL